MTISRTERLILWNQYEILKNFDKNNPFYDKYQEILSSGYESEYDTIFGGISEEPTDLATCKEVYEILEMWRAFEFKTSETFKKAHNFKWYDGFDGNNEPSHCFFAKFLIDIDGKFQELSKYPRNSHAHRLSRYKEYLRKYKSTTNFDDLDDTIAAKILA